MTGLWTPYGEVSPEDDSADENATQAVPAGETGAQSEPTNPDDVFAGMSEEDKAAALEQITQMRAELLSTPARDIIGNHIVGFYELASVHLSEAAQSQGTDREARLAEASLCIDAMASVVNGLGDRLAQHSEPLHAALSQMQMAFVEVQKGATTDS